MILTPSTIGAIQQDPLRRIFKQASLDLRFADNKSLVDATTGAQLVTFTRASSGTYVGSDGLIQSAVTNLLVRSEEFDNAVWLKTGSSVDPNVEVAPNGTLSADKLIEDTATSAHQLAVNLGFNYISGTTYTLSCYVKSADRTKFLLAFRSDWFPPDSGVVANLTTGSITAGVNSVGSITPVGNGWYRISNTATADATGSSPSDLFLGLVDDAGSSAYTGDGTSGIYIWGAQLEQSTALGEYIPTTSTINSAPRFDHNPTTGESLGLLVEEQRTNLVLRSEEVNNAYWVKTTSTITANESTAPDGTLTADLWTSTATNGIIEASITKDTVSRTYTGSLWVKGDIAAFTLTIDNGGTVNRGRVLFNLSSNTITTTANEGNFTGTSGSITLYPNDWKRVTITTTTSTLTTMRFRPFFSGISGASVRVWGAQVEEGAFATSYIPTTTATVTRSADVASDTTRGGNIRSLYVQFRSPASGTRPVVSLDDNTANERIELLTSGTDPKLLVTDGGSAVADLNGGAVVANVAARAAARFNTDNYAISINGSTSQLDTSGTLPTVNRIRIGSNQAGGYLNGTIARITGWDTTLPMLPPISG